MTDTIAKVEDSAIGKPRNYTSAEKKRTRVVPVTLKIVVTFSIFLLLSNFTTNYINLVFNRSELFSLMNQLLIKDLKNIYSYCNNQYAIYQFDKNLQGSIDSIEVKGLHEIKNEKAVILGIKPDGTMMFQASRIDKPYLFPDTKTLNAMNRDLKKNIDENHINFTFNSEEYFGIYKFNSKWGVFILRAEQLNEFYKESRLIFRNISIIIVVITFLLAIIGILMLRFILRYIQFITSEIRNMIESQELGIIDMSKATNDDIAYLGVAFNSLSSLVNNLMYIFRKFTNQDIVAKAYKDKEVKLEGAPRELTILFSDIKSFTFITEMLGNDIIKLLNLYYDTAIREVVKQNGVIGSIIGDAILAVYGALDTNKNNKSYESILSAYKLQEVTEELRNRMTAIKKKLEEEKGQLSLQEMKIFRAVLLEIGVGIDGGLVFYGTLGSYVRMTNTVIGDNVNSASRLEGLTRIYKVPVICSAFVKEDIEENVDHHDLYFIEIDTVMVKGKTTGKKIYWPIFKKEFDFSMTRQISAFEQGLGLYYKGDWKAARLQFDKCDFAVADVFRERTKMECPDNWNGIWEMKTK